jgi:hypothetical protein
MKRFNMLLGIWGGVFLILLLFYVTMLRKESFMIKKGFIEKRVAAGNVQAVSGH